MGWFTDFVTAIGRMSGFVVDQAEEQLPEPLPITTREDLGWDDVPPKPSAPERMNAAAAKAGLTHTNLGWSGPAADDEEPTTPGNHKPPKAAA